MKTKIIKNSKLGISITDAIFGIVVIAAVYGAYLYIPLVYKSQELEAIAKDYTFKSGSAKEEKIQAAVIEDALKKLEISLNEEDVVVTKNEQRTRIDITWNAVMELPFGLQIPRTFHVSYDRKQL